MNERIIAHSSDNPNDLYSWTL